MLIIYLCVIELILNVLKWLYNPKKSYYGKEHFYKILYASYPKLNDYENFDSIIINILESVKIIKRINQAVLSLLSIHFIESIIVSMVYICLYEDGRSEIFLHIILAIVVFDFVYTFITWCMSLAIVSKVNNIKKHYPIVDCTKDIKINIVIVIIILSIDLLLYVFHF